MLDGWDGMAWVKRRTYRVAVVADRVHARDAGLLQADLRARGDLLLAPVGAGGRLDGVGVDLVLLLGGGEGGEGGEAEGECGTHGDGGEVFAGCLGQRVFMWAAACWPVECTYRCWDRRDAGYYKVYG